MLAQGFLRDDHVISPSTSIDALLTISFRVTENQIRVPFNCGGMPALPVAFSTVVLRRRKKSGNGIRFCKQLETSSFFEHQLPAS